MNLNLNFFLKKVLEPHYFHILLIHLNIPLELIVCLLTLLFFILIIFI